MPKSDWVMCCAINNSGTVGASGGLNNIVSVYEMPEDGPSYIDASEDGNEIALTGGYFLVGS